MFKDEKKSEIYQGCGKWRVRSSMLIAFYIRTNVICDLCFQKVPGILPDRSQLVLLWGQCKIAKNQREGDECFATKSLENLLISRNNPLWSCEGVLMPFCLECAKRLACGTTLLAAREEANTLRQLLPEPGIAGQAF